MKKLFIVESPGKAKTIKKYLGEDFIVTSTMGHIKDLPSKALGIEINPPNNVDITYDIMEGKEKVIKELKKYIDNASEIYLAPDADREGEIIAYHIKELIDSRKNKDKKLVYRVTYNEVSKKAILESITHKREIDQNMVAAQQARRILDRLVGYKVSPVLWRKIAKGLSAGRVQSVALKLVCKRDEEIKNFITTEYWSVHGLLHATKIQVEFLLKKNKKEVLTEKDADNILASAEKATWEVSEVKDREKKRKPLSPFVTSSLQQSAYNVLHFNVQQTMMYAQQLYEGIVLDDENTPVALITYMRTDSTRISDEALEVVRKYISSEIGIQYTPKSPIKYSKKEAAQDAHEAIRPIDPWITPESIKNKVKKELYELYYLIWKRFVASQMEDAIYTTRSIHISDQKNELIGKMTGSIILFDGFLKVYDTKEEDEDEQKLPPQMEVGQKVVIDNIAKKQHFTQPPARYSEATLVKELEQKGIGRPSTYVPILRTIRDRLYTELDSKKRFMATKLGFEVCNILEENMTKIMDYSFTATMEEELDKIAQGEMARNKLIFDFYDYLIPAVNEFLSKKIEKQYQDTNLSCPECESKLLIKWGKTGEFIGCSKFPECKYTSNFIKENNEIILTSAERGENSNMLDILCEKCQKPMLKKMGRFGEFIACSGYPECNYILQEKTKHMCPGCGKNPLSKKSWKGKIFWGCKGYPDCKFSINGGMIEKDCPICGYHFAKEDGTCLNKNCNSK